MSDPIEVIIEEQTVQVNLPDGVAAVGGILSAVRAVEDSVEAIAASITDSTDDAEAAALLAQKWASVDEDTVVADGKYSAAHHALKAADSATAAEGFADDAEGFKTAAEAAETATDTLKSDTNTLKLAAESARDTAVTAKNASESARDITLAARDVVTAAETNVETLESTVAGYVTAAETSKDDAETAQLAAEAAETNAAASESAAAADRIAAQTARTGAETAETNAEAAQAAAESAQAASESARTDALAAQSAAEAAQSGAETAESNASDSADAAAASYASLAGEVAQAEDAADLAEEWANNPENTVVTGTSNYSAKHWAIQAQASATGALIYRGSYNASSDTAPAGPNELGDYYKISVAGDFGGHEFKVGDSAIYNGSGWDKVDNTESVSSVAGRLGDVILVKGDVGLGNVANVDQTNATNITSGTLASARLPATIDANTTGNAATATEADTLDGEHGAYYLDYTNFTNTPSTIDAEQVEDIVGAMVAGNTETGITVTYDDADGTLDFVLTDGGAAAVSSHESTYDHDEFVTNASADAAYLAIDGTADDSDLLQGQNGAYYLAYGNLTDTPSIPNTESIQDIVGAMFSGNTETRITATYQDGDGTIDLVVNVTKSDVGLSNVTNVDTTNATNISSGTLSASRLPATIAANTTGTAAALSDGVKNSIEIDSGDLQLDGDEASPGNNKVYGTDGSGVKGWKDDPAGGLKTFTLAENMTVGDVVGLNSSGDAAPWSGDEITVKDSILTSGVVENFGAASFENSPKFLTTPTGYGVCYYTDNSTSKKFYHGLVNKTGYTPSLGASATGYTLPADGALHSVDISPNGSFIVIGIEQIGTVHVETKTVNNLGAVTGAGGAYSTGDVNSEVCFVTVLTNSIIICVHFDDSNGATARLIRCTSSGSSVTLADTSSFTGEGLTKYCTALIRVSDTKAAILYKNSTNVCCRILTVRGPTLTAGSEFVIGALTSDYNASALAIDENTLIVSYKDNPAKVTLLDVEGATLTQVSNVVNLSPGGVMHIKKIYGGYIAVLKEDTAGTEHLDVSILSQSGNTLELHSTISISTVGSLYENGLLFPDSPDGFVVGWKYDSDVGFTGVSWADLPATGPTIGILQESGTTSQAKPVAMGGDISSGHSGLTVNALYYAESNNTIVQSGSESGDAVLLGRAISATELKLSGTLFS